MALVAISLMVIKLTAKPPQYRINSVEERGHKMGVDVVKIKMFNADNIRANYKDVGPTFFKFITINFLSVIYNPQKSSDPCLLCGLSTNFKFYNTPK